MWALMGKVGKRDCPLSLHCEILEGQPLGPRARSWRCLRDARAVGGVRGHRGLAEQMGVG